MRAATVLGVIVGGVTFGFTGFAFALFAISALALEFPPAVVVPAVMLVGDTLILMLAWEQRASLLPRKLRYVPPFSPWSAPFVLAGLVMGTLLLSRAPAWTGRFALGTLLLAFTRFEGRSVADNGRNVSCAFGDEVDDARRRLGPYQTSTRPRRQNPARAPGRGGPRDRAAAMLVVDVWAFLC